MWSERFDGYLAPRVQRGSIPAPPAARRRELLLPMSFYIPVLACHKNLRATALAVDGGRTAI
jgi:hypothetical protein